MQTHAFRDYILNEPTILFGNQRNELLANTGLKDLIEGNAAFRDQIEQLFLSSSRYQNSLCDSAQTSEIL